MAAGEDVPPYGSLARPPADSPEKRNVEPLPRGKWTEDSVANNKGTVACVAGDCKQIDSAPFGTETHTAIVKTAKTCSDPLIRAVYWQDYYHQFESKAHFDNCAFEDSIRYIEELQQAVDAHVNTARTPDTDKLMFTLGQALHAIQDFYAHSDYIERMQARHARFRDVPIVAVWLEEGQSRLRELARDGLVSGVVWWGSPKYCTADTPTHSQLNKDEEGKGHGAEKTLWPNWSHFDAARRLAQEATEEFLRHAFRRWPILANKCGNAVVYVVAPESRKDPPQR